jgi:hypothetical protein
VVLAGNCPDCANRLFKRNVTEQLDDGQLDELRKTRNVDNVEIALCMNNECDFAMILWDE